MQLVVIHSPDVCAGQGHQHFISQPTSQLDMGSSFLDYEKKLVSSTSSRFGHLQISICLG